MSCCRQCERAEAAIVGIMAHLEALPELKPLSGFHHMLLVIMYLISLGELDADIVREPGDWNETIARQLMIIDEDMMLLESIWTQLEGKPPLFWAASWSVLL